MCPGNNLSFSLSPTAPPERPGHAAASVWPVCGLLRMSSDDSSEDEDEKQRRLRISGILVTSEQVKAEEATRATEAAKPRDVASEGDGGATGRKCSEFEKHQTRQLHALLERTFAKRLQPGVW